jgi:hypothetical protein
MYTTFHKALAISAALTAVPMKIPNFWDTMSCRVTYRPCVWEEFADSVYRVIQKVDCPEDGGSTALRNVGSHTPVYTLSCPRR